MPPARPALALPLDLAATETLVPPGAGTLIQRRHIRAPRERVWAAWTDPDHLAQWWGPKGFSLTTDCFEFREGGHWLFTMHGPDPDPESAHPGGPRDFPNHIVWRQIRSGAQPGGPQGADAPWQLAYDHVQVESMDAVLFSTTVSFEVHGEDTLLTWTADFGSAAHRDAVIRDYGAAEGGRETTARLAHHTETADFDALDAFTGHRLILSRVLDVPRPLVWRAWTDPQWLMPWFCPRPYAVDRCEIDLRPGGRFYTHMVGPDGFAADNDGSWLEVQALERLSFTDLLLADWVPHPNPGLRFTASVLLADAGPGRTHYTAIARHAGADARALHAQMGFHEGWGTACDQLVALLQGRAARG